MMRRAQAAAALLVATTADHMEVERAFRAAARRAHPDAGDHPAEFRRLVRARTVLLESPASSEETPDIVSRSTLARRRWDRRRRKLWRRLGIDQRPRVH